MSASYPRTQNILLCIQIAASTAACFAGLSIGYWLRFNTLSLKTGAPFNQIPYKEYLPLISLGTVFLTATFIFMNLHAVRLTLRPRLASYIILKAIFVWLLIFLSTSLILKFDPSISRFFVILSCLTCFVIMVAWRYLLYFIISQSRWRERLMQRIAFVGWSDEAARLSEAIALEKNHPDQVVGIVATSNSSTKSSNNNVPIIGHIDEIELLLSKKLIDAIIIADPYLSKNQTLHVANLCEERYIEFKVIPSFFQIFVSNLRMQTVSGVPILGVEELSIRRPGYRFLKRVFDLLGAVVGLILSAPVILVLAILIRRESRGPILYRQIRTGLHGQPFIIYKLRSMRTDAETGKGAQWAVENDPRRLKIGAFMREWNLDELPQFWNILKGDMSLVGPRPERPELIERFQKEIPHYNPRHAARPGLTGWAQIHGLRGNTSLEDRIRYDLHYIENWSFWLDIQIIILTFLNRKNAY